jgi:hypothetical protein
MMQVWFKATLSEFKRIEKLIPRIYRSLQVMWKLLRIRI